MLSSAAVEDVEVACAGLLRRMRFSLSSSSSSSDAPPFETLLLFSSVDDATDNLDSLPLLRFRTAPLATAGVLDSVHISETAPVVAFLPLGE